MEEHATSQRIEPDPDEGPASNGLDEGPLDTAGRWQFDAIIGSAIVVLVGLTLISLLPGRRFIVSNGTLDVVLNTLTAVAAAGAATLAWVRYRIERDIAAVYESSAFIVMCMTRLLIVGIASFGSPETVGMSLDGPQQWPLYAWSLARLVAALLLLSAAGIGLRRTRRKFAPVWLIAVAPVVVLLAAFVTLRSAESSLPPFIGSTGLAALRGDAAAPAGMEPLGFAVQAVIAATYLAGAVLYRAIARERGRGYARYLAVALVVAGVSQLHWALLPGIYRPLVTIDDLLRAVFSVVLLLGIEAQSRGDLQALRRANTRLVALRTADAERAALEARARLARDVHDGLAQDLWLLKLRQARLAGVESLPDEARGLVAELGEAVDRALGDARSVVASTRSVLVERTLEDSLQQAVSEFEERTGIPTHLERVGTVPGLDDARTAEVVRIVREALTNVRKHADATIVRVSVGAADDRAAIDLSISDNGRGFDPDAIGPTSFGLLGMRERATLLGGQMSIASRPADGTTIAIRLPASAGPAATAPASAAAAAAPGFQP